MEVISPIVRRWLEEASEDPHAFWARAARRSSWFRPWNTVFEQEPSGSFRWFSGGLTNISYNALDRHVNDGQGGRAALVALNERGDRHVYTYAQLLAGTKAVAAGLRALGVRRGDRVAIYMPTTPEAIMAMLACTRIGAIHLVVFAGFGSGALGERIRLAGARVLLMADVTFRKGKQVTLTEIVKQTLSQPDSPIQRVVVLKRGTEPVELEPGRDILWDDFIAAGRGQATEHEEMESNEPAYILATSGTTASPKLAVHSHGAYQVGIESTAQWCFGLQPQDVWWSTSDIGWVVGHSFIVYAPLLAGCTTLAYEGAIDHPSPDAFYRIIEEFKVSGIFTAPTAVRLLMRYGSEPAKSADLSSVIRVFCAGEVLNPPAWEWLQKDVFGNKVPVIDHMWQTETGGPVFGNPYGIDLLPIKPGSAGIPLPGFFADIRRPDGTSCDVGERGLVVLTQPFPGLTPTIWGDPDRYLREYWNVIPGVYLAGDAGYRDEDGYYWFSGRADEVMNIAGHRLGTIEVETALLRHPAVVEAGVTGRPDELRAEVIAAFVVLRPGSEPSEQLKQDLLDTVRQDLGPVAVIGDLNFVSMLPKTRSGKIMRRVFKAVILGRDPGDISTIEEEGSVEEARRAWQQMSAEVNKR